MLRGKVIFAGGASAGKTSIVRRYLNRKFDDYIPTTVTADFYKSEFQVDGQAVCLQIWDTAGQEKFSSVQPVFFRGAQFALIVFDVSSRPSFEVASFWLNQVRLKSLAKTTIYLVANKIDVVDWAVTREDVQKYATNEGLQLLETSAKTGAGVDDLFKMIGRDYLARRGEDEQAQRKEVNVEDPAKKGTGCC